MCHYVLLDHSYAKPDHDELCRRLQDSENKVKEYAKKLYRVNGEKRKLEEKVRNLEHVLSECKEKFSISDESMDILSKAASKVPKDLFERAIKKLKYSMHPFYSPEMK